MAQFAKKFSYAPSCGTISLVFAKEVNAEVIPLRDGALVIQWNSGSGMSGHQNHLLVFSLSEYGERLVQMLHGQPPIWTLGPSLGNWYAENVLYRQIYAACQWGFWTIVRGHKAFPGKRWLASAIERIALNTAQSEIEDALKRFLQAQPSGFKRYIGEQRYRELPISIVATLEAVREYYFSKGNKLFAPGDLIGPGESEESSTVDNLPFREIIARSGREPFCEIDYRRFRKLASQVEILPSWHARNAEGARLFFEASFESSRLLYAPRGITRENFLTVWGSHAHPERLYRELHALAADDLTAGSS